VFGKVEATFEAPVADLTAVILLVLLLGLLLALPRDAQDAPFDGHVHVFLLHAGELRVDAVLRRRLAHVAGGAEVAPARQSLPDPAEPQQSIEPTADLVELTKRIPLL